MMTHADLVRRAMRWLVGSQRCRVVVADMEAGGWGACERVDAMGWTRRTSILVECKVSRADFMADKRKPWRADPLRGVGELRYYMAPPGVLSPEELPPHWGLLTVAPSGTLRHPVRATPQPANRAGETWLLCNAARAGRRDFGPLLVRCSAIHADAQPERDLLRPATEPVRETTADSARNG
jgi:hypothetical protein